ncbi:MAG: GIY-YIG nuclease family protein [Coriobacteriales bacterium]|nr:GIY-YIG nuclease family protein [Coriobacteriales bacterium]
MDANRKAQLKEMYRNMTTWYGVIRLTNTHNKKMFIASYPNLKNKELVLRMQLDDGRHPNATLQADWKALGGDAFVYEVLEKRDAAKVEDARFAAHQLEKQHLKLLKPYGERGYNKPPR